MDQQTSVCLRCNQVHINDFRACSMVKAIEVNLIGQVTRVEFMTPMDFPPQRGEDPQEQEYEKLKPSKEPV